MSTSTAENQNSRNQHSSTRLIVIQSEKIVQEKRKNSSIPSNVLEIASAVSGALSFVSIYPALIKAGVEVAKAVDRARESGLLVETLTAEEAGSFVFPPGHPQLGTLYISHPAKPTVFYTAAMFHRMAFEHKFSEAVDLLMNLGATTLEVEHIEGWSREFSSTVSAPIPHVAASADVGLSSSSKSNSNLLFKAQLDNKQPPALPDDMVWFNHESTWENVARGRLKHGLTEFSLAVSYQDDFGVNADLKIKAEKAGLKLGGSFQSHKSTTWKISGRFNDMKTGAA